MCLSLATIYLLGHPESRRGGGGEASFVRSVGPGDDGTALGMAVLVEEIETGDYCRR